MISREHYAKEILQLLGDVFATSRVGYGEQNEGVEFVSDKERSNFPHSTELSNQVISDFRRFTALIICVIAGGWSLGTSHS